MRGRADGRTDGWDVMDGWAGGGRMDERTDRQR